MLPENVDGVRVYRRWSQTDAGVVLRSAAQGQEFILDADHYPEATAWARGLLDSTVPNA